MASNLPLVLIVIAYLAVFVLRAAGRLAPAARPRRRTASPALYGGMFLYVFATLFGPGAGVPAIATLALQSLGALLVIAGLFLSVQAA